MEEQGDFLESYLPASIDIEEMIIGRLTAKQLAFVCVGSAICYNLMFKISNRYIGWSLGIIIAILIYFMAFKKMKKYDRFFYEHWWYYYKYNSEQQIFLNK